MPFSQTPQITGQPSVLYFSTKLLRDAGFSLDDAGGMLESESQALHPDH